MKTYILGLSFLLLFSCNKDVITKSSENTLMQTSNNSLTSIPEAAGSNIMANEVLVKFKTGISAEKRFAILSQIQGTVAEHIHTAAMKYRNDNDGIYLIHTNLNAVEAISKMKSNADIVYIEPNFIYQHEATSSDPLFINGTLWGMNGTFGIQADKAWVAGHTGSSNVYIGVIDEGAMFNHEDLTANFWTNTLDLVNGKDDDGNGYIDDIHGWDFSSNDNSTFDGVGDDHGTHVSGTIGGMANTKGVVGVNWNVKLISAKFLGSRGGTTANAIKSVDYITTLKTKNGLNIVATNNSWGGGGFSQGLQDAIERANAANILFVAAAGNNSSNNETTANYPSNYPNSNVIAVAALTSTGALASYSNYGATQVDLGAPGSGIWSTVPVSSKGAIISSYASYNGTSMATPHVTGACALYASSHPGASAADIKNAILNNVVSTVSLSGKTATGGRLNVSAF